MSIGNLHHSVVDPVGFAFLSQGRFGATPAPQAEHLKIFGMAGVAWDGSTTHRAGARMGPDAIRRASQMLCEGLHPHFDLSPLAYLDDHGDLRLPNTALERMREALQAQAQRLMAHQHMIWLGGDHAITLSLLRALKQVRGAPVALLHFDAHCDTWEDHFGEPSGHGTWVYEAVQEELVVPEGVIQIGIRSAADRTAREYVNTIGGRVWTARELRGLENVAQLQALITDTLQRVDAAEQPLYVSFDIDCLDPAFAPGTGTPEPGGLSTSAALTLLEELCSRLPCVGMDCVEVSPPYDHAELTSNAAAHLVWTYMSAVLAGG
jgi:agmatinase